MKRIFLKDGLVFKRYFELYPNETLQTYTIKKFKEVKQDLKLEIFKERNAKQA
jgi:hypothetical protein